MWSHQYWAYDHREDVAKNKLHGVSVDSRDPYRGGPLMVLLVDGFVQRAIVDQPIDESAARLSAKQQQPIAGLIYLTANDETAALSGI